MSTVKDLSQSKNKSCDSFFFSSIYERSNQKYKLLRDKVMIWIWKKWFFTARFSRLIVSSNDQLLKFENIDDKCIWIKKSFFLLIGVGGTGAGAGWIPNSSLRSPPMELDLEIKLKKSDSRLCLSAAVRVVLLWILVTTKVSKFCNERPAIGDMKDFNWDFLFDFLATSMNWTECRSETWN